MTKPSFESRMMNIHSASGAACASGYAYGHRDARHEAARIAMEADAELAVARDDITRLVATAAEEAKRAEALAALLSECADDLEHEINSRYSLVARRYPTDERLYQRDMDMVRRARSALGQEPKP